MTRPALPLAPDLAERLAGIPCLLLLDVDGTLSPIAGHPGDAIVPSETKRVLSDIVQLPAVSVAVISGRGALDAKRLVGVEGTWVIGNHGIELMTPAGDLSADARVAAFASNVAAAAARALEIAQPHAGVIVEDKRWTISVHYRLADPSIVTGLRAALDTTAHECGLVVTLGKQVIELRPPVSIDKGTAAIALAERLGVLGPGASILCAGDDRTDEDMFRALRARDARAVTVRVASASGAPGTTAEFRVDNPDALRELLLLFRGLR